LAGKSWPSTLGVPQCKLSMQSCSVRSGLRSCIPRVGWELWGKGLQGVTRGYKDGLQLESLADGNWLVKQNQPVSKIETGFGARTLTGMANLTSSISVRETQSWATVSLT